MVHLASKLALVVGLLLLDSAARAAAPVCLPETDTRIALARGSLAWPLTLRAPNFESAIFGLVRTGPGDVLFVDRVSVALVAPVCRVAFQRSYDGDSARVRAVTLQSRAIVDVVTEGHGGSGNGFDHHLLLNGKDRVAPIETPDFSHTNMGGFYLGDLGQGRGEGAVVWDAIWSAEDQTHYSPHRYSFTFYRWNGGGFEKLEEVRTSTKFDPDPDAAAKGAGYGFRDQTGQDVMPFSLVDEPGRQPANASNPSCKPAGSNAN